MDIDILRATMITEKTEKLKNIVELAYDAVDTLSKRKDHQVHLKLPQISKPICKSYS